MKSTTPAWSAQQFHRLLGSAFLLAAVTVHAQDQTATVSPIVVNGALPFDLSLSIHDSGAATVPNLQSYAFGQVGNDYIFVAGRTNGLHGFSGTGEQNFPPASQNSEIWVLNPVTNQSWSRSLNDGTAGLSPSQVNSLSATNTEFYQSGSTLYVAGGYVYDSVNDNFTTYNTLTALNLAGVDSWVKTGSGSLVQNFRQTTSSTVQVTGGGMTQINGLTLLSFGQDFEGSYTVNANGIYSQQVRTFNIVDNGSTLSIANVSAPTPDPNLRRRDLNVVPTLTPDGHGGLTPGLVGLSGVFLPGPNGNAWTVPVEISADGTHTMADPTAPGTFKQGMNNYHSPVISLYDTSSNDSHNVVFGGISLQYYNYSTHLFETHESLPFINQSTDIVRDANGVFTQYLVTNAAFPDITWSNTTASGTLYFGAGAEFLPASGLPLLSNGMIDLQSLTGTTLLGYIYGGIMAKNHDLSSQSDSTASSDIFDVYYTPTVIPEPATVAGLLGAAAGLLALARSRKLI